MLDYQAQRNNLKDDPLRPQFHFLPPQNWMNDPNGLIHWRGKYHIFYQYNPEAPEWGKIHWGHAVSDDLVHWRDLPIALSPTPNSYDENGIWSGCAVDNDGVATIFYTGVSGGHHEKQTVCIATSTDENLLNWDKHPANPIIAAPPDEFSECGFRDPYVWRSGGRWYMVIGAGKPAGGEAVLLYRSTDLLNWEYLEPLIVSNAENDFLYECPSFFPLGDKWVLTVSLMELSHMEYFVGIFWNDHFIVETHGRFATPPFYAGLCFADDSGRRLMLGWLQETRDMSESLAAGWAGTMSLPLQLMLLEDNTLAISPVREVLDDELTQSYRHYINVDYEKLAQIQAQINTNRLKIVISDANDISKVIFIDGSIVEIFDFPDYRVHRTYERVADLALLPDFVAFPVERMSIWEMPSIW